MLAWAGDGGVRAVGSESDVTVRTEGWRDGSGPTVRAAEVTVEGAAAGLAVPVETASLDSEGVLAGAARDVDGGTHRLDCVVAPGPAEAAADRRDHIELTLRFEGPGTVRREGDSVRLSFPAGTPVTFGFTERTADLPTVTVPPTTEGIAAGVSHLSAALATTGPARSHPALRRRPPAVEVGEDLSVPDAVREATPGTGIRLEVPDRLAALFVGAPLAYYLGAEMTVTDRDAPRLVAREVDETCRFEPLPTFQQGASRLLRRTFYLDSLVRQVEPPTNRDETLDRLGLDPERVRRLSPAERLARYRRVADAELDDELPEWHFASYVAPERENLACLPDLLDALSLVYLPESSELRQRDLLERTLDDAYRSSSSAGRSVATVDVVDPELQDGRIHGWLAPGTPIDAFKTTPAAYEHRRSYRNRNREADCLDVTVVLNDGAMGDEHAAVADTYRERAADLPLSVTVREHLSTDELAAVFAAPNDFVHYIGHCDRDGLRCPDGRLAAASLDTCETRTFFLNACGSYHEGLDLVERGSVGGAVTLTKVLDRQAAKVGKAFARLLVHGFGLEQALQLARRRIMMGKEYAVVGDGTYTVAPRSRTPVLGRLTDRSEGYELTCMAASVSRTGDTYRPPGSDDSYLHGTETSRQLPRDALVSTLRGRAFPVIYDGEFHWSRELADALSV
ncbi:MAG: hypothetical protein ABEJ30_07705 [Halorientalis sp.]